MVRQCSLLWDTTTEQYRRTDLKRIHWDQIAQALGSKFTGIYIIYFISLLYSVIV